MARGGQAERQRLNLAAGWERRDVVYQYANGWTLEQVVTLADQKREGELMGNCAGEYLPWCPEHVMLSLRDPRGRPHVDVIVYGGEGIEIEGRACTEVKFRYERMIGDFARAGGVRFDPAGLKRDRYEYERFLHGAGEDCEVLGFDLDAAPSWQPVHAARRLGALRLPALP